MWDLEAALDHLRTHAQASSRGQCARYVRQAVEAGGVTLARTLSAKNYGPSLEGVGFVSQGALTAGYRAGDVAVIQATSRSTHGHVAMYDGEYWISDFKQMNGFYPGATYRKEKPAYVIYRYPGLDTASVSVGRGQERARAYA